MAQSRRIQFMAGAALVALAAIAANAGAAKRNERASRQQIDRSFALQPGASVEVSNISGPVTVVTVAGGHAEVHVTSMADSQRELECARIEVTDGPQGVKVRRMDPERSECRQVQSRQEVRLVLPRSTALTLSGIAGDVEIGMIDGPLRLQAIAGSTHVAGARSADISALAGGLSLGLDGLDAKGVRISGISGSVDLALRPGINADVQIGGVNGSVRSASRGLRLVERDRGYEARLGAGGPKLSISGVMGPVRLKIS
jgi:hypothetical protein